MSYVTIREIVSLRPLVAVDPEETVRTVCLVLQRERTGALPVMSGDSLVGIVTEGDVVHRAVGRWMNPDATQVFEIMTQDPPTVEIGAPLSAALAVMQSRNCRFVPVMDRGMLAGMLSMQDLPVERCLAMVFDGRQAARPVSNIF